jgi:hypothetical protein
MPRIPVIFLLPVLFGLVNISVRATPFDASKYPSSDELVLAYLPADVQPIRSVRVKSPIDGLLSLALPSTGARLPEGAVWGEFDPERLKLESEAVALARTLFEEKASPQLSLELARTAGELAERRAELDRQIGMLTRIANDPSLAELYGGDTAADSTAKVPTGDEIATLSNRLKQQLALIDRVLRFAGTPGENEHEQRALELKLKVQELDVAQRLRELRLTMPFEGEIILIPTAPPAGRPLRVPTGTDLALIQDFSAIQARVPVRRAEWRIVTPSRLYLRYVARPGGVITAGYQRSVIQETFGRDELLYIFQFPDAFRPLARTLAGGQVMMHLVLKLEQDAVIIPKIDLLVASPAAFREGGWETGIAAVLPGARLLAVGDTHLAVALASAPAAP